MTHCTHCAAQLPDSGRFCAECGTPTTSAPDAGPGRVLPPAPAPGTRAAPALSFDWRALLVGNWVGAGLVALATAFTTGLLGMLLALLAKPEDFGLSNTLTLATLIATGAFGADLRAEGSEDGYLAIEGSATLGAVPLTITLVAIAVAVVGFRRITRHHTSGLRAVGDAARTALLFGVALLVPALVFRTDNDELGRGWARELSAGSSGIDASVGADAAGAFFVGMVLLLIVLAASTLLRRDLWSGPMARVQALVAAPLAGLATLAALLPVAGVIGYLSLGLFGEETDTDLTSDDLGAFVALLVGYAGNAGFHVLTLGVGSRVGAVGRASGEPSSSEWERLWGQVTEEEPGLWVSPLVMLAVLLVSTLVVLRRTDREGALPTLGAWLVGLVVVVPLLSRLASLHLSGSAAVEGEEFDGSAYVGPDGLQTTVLLVLVAALVALALALSRGLVDAASLRRGVARSLRGLQSAPTAPAASDEETTPRSR